MSQLLKFEKDHLNELDEWINAQSNTQVVVLVDENTKRDCLPLLPKSMGEKIDLISEIPSGEEFKTIETAVKLWAEWTSNQLDRNALVANLGGGVLSDLGGFAASCYKRGIDFVNVPTTLLNMVDASVGGKTGIDFQEYKNQIGVFQEAKGVFIYPKFLKTLPKREFRSGFAEIIKYGLTLDKELYAQCKAFPEFYKDDLLAIIKKSVTLKQFVVKKDFKENGLRKVLNFGHTIGHAVESHFLKTENTLLHGEAIAVGMICEAWLSVQYCDLPLDRAKEIKQMILSIFPKVDISEESFDHLIALMAQDKKNKKGIIECSLMGKEIGSFVLGTSVSSKLIRNSFQFYAQ